jgi:hypothetical protein
MRPIGAGGTGTIACTELDNYNFVMDLDLDTNHLSSSSNATRE